MGSSTARQVEEADTLNAQGLAAVTLSLHWSDERAVHEDLWHVERFSVWRESDAIPVALAQQLLGLGSGQSLAPCVLDDEQIGAWQANLQLQAKPQQFDCLHRRGRRVEPRLGRFYPQGFFHHLSGIYQDGIQPARITRLQQDCMQVDLNHPLARYRPQVGLTVEQVLPGFDRRGGRCQSPLDELLQYAGLCAPLQGAQACDFDDQPQPLPRADEQDDRLFYQMPRMVQHLDAKARDILNGLYRRLIPSGARVLDLMASHDSHLQGIELQQLQVLGMNEQELLANDLAHVRHVQDLNRDALLPLAENSLDVVLCSASIEYLARPQVVIAEVMRVLRPGGRFIVSFSNRWFPTKAIRVWGDLHEYERLGMVLQWLQQAGFTHLHSFSAQGWPRPEDDPHVARTPFADPIFAAWGEKML